MLFSIALILLFGMLFRSICEKIKLPGLLGMLLTGIFLGPYGLNLLDSSILSISTELRKIALIIILTRAGLGLELSSLKSIGRSALCMCFLPATLELAGVILLAPTLLNCTLKESAVLGAVLAAVSPAVVVPRMVKLMEQGYGTNKNIPQMILAGASVDDVYVIVLFTTFLNLLQGEKISLMRFLNIPVSILLGILIGLFLGWLSALLFQKIKIRDSAKVLIFLSFSLLLVTAEDNISTAISFSSLISIMFMGIGLRNFRSHTAKNLSAKYNKLWVGAEIFLFVLVGANVDINYFEKVGVPALLLILLALIFRMLGVYLCVIKTNLNKKERLFSMLAYCPKATVQAAIGGIPLSMGLSCGDTILTVAVLAIVFSAPFGAFLIDYSYQKLLYHQS